METRTKQKDKAEAACQVRSETLSAAGVSDKDKERDAVLRAAKAKLKKAQQRLSAIEVRNAHVQKTKEEKSKADSPPEGKKTDKPKKGEEKVKTKEKVKKPKKETE
jgi:hypothetical protein